MWKLTIALHFCFLVIQAGELRSQSSSELDSIVRYDYQGGDTLTSLKTIFTYNDAGLVKEELEQIWSLIRMQWESESRITISYQDQRVDTMTTWEYHQTGWIPKTRTVTHYDDQGNSLEIVSQTWDDTMNIWHHQTRTRQEASSANSRYLLHSTWNPDLQSWIPVDSTSSILSEDGRVLSDTSYAWISFGGFYFYSSLTLYVYDRAQNLSTRSRYNFNVDSFAFLPRSRDTFAYDQQRFEILSRFDSWNGQTQSWEPSLRIDRSVNDDGYLSESRIFFFDFFSGQLIPTSRLEYMYTDGYDRGLADSLVLSVKNFIYIGNVEIPDWKTHYFYSLSETTSKRNFDGKDLIIIYPNPASDFVSLEGNLTAIKYYRWITLDGKILSDSEISGNQIRVPVISNGPAPLYLILADPDRRPLRIAKILITGH
jgi:hypothetical protein